MTERRTAPRRLACEEAAKDDDLLGTICHDLRDPLSSITMGSRFLKKQLPRAAAGDDAREAAAAAVQCVRMTEAIERAAERMNRLITDFHDLSRLERGRIAPGLALAPHAALALLAHAAELAPRRVTLAAVAPALAVRADRARVVQALSKLIDNAVAAHARRGLDEGAITLGARAEGALVHLYVQDEGGGVDAAVLDHVFDYTWLAARRARSGAGLGLAIARGIAEAHGGELCIESEPGVGVVASFTLPSA